MKNVFTTICVIMLFLNTNNLSAQHACNDKCCVTLSEVLDEMGVQYQIENQNPIQTLMNGIDEISHIGYFYYPNAPGDAGISEESFRVMVQDSIRAARDEYYGHAGIERNYRIFVLPMQVFIQTDFMDKIFALSATGMGDYAWVNQVRDSFHLSEVHFILPNGYPTNAQGNTNPEKALINNNSNRSLVKYLAGMHLSVITNGQRSIINHAAAHTYGVQHRLIDGNIGGDANAYAAFNQGSFGTSNMPSYMGGAVTVNAPSAPNFVWNGVPLGSTQENAKATIEDEILFINGLYEETYVSAEDATVCVGSSFDLEVETNGDLTFNVLTGDLSISGLTVTANSSGTIEVVSQQSGTAYDIRDTITVTILQSQTSVENVSICNGQTYVLPDGTSVSSGGTYQSILVAINGCDSTVITNLGILPHETMDTTITIHTGETVNLPDGTILNDQSNGQTGSYIISGGATNGCDLTIHWVVEVVTAVIDVGKDKRISVYPNPFNEQIFFNIDPSLTIEKVVLITSTGQKIYEGPFITPTVQVNGASGMYILQLMSKDNVFIQTLIKQ